MGFPGEKVEIHEQWHYLGGVWSRALVCMDTERVIAYEVDVIPPYVFGSVKPSWLIKTHWVQSNDPWLTAQSTYGANKLS